MISGPRNKLSANTAAVADLIVCPACQADFTHQSSKLVCKKCHQQFSTENDIPRLIVKAE